MTQFLASKAVKPFIPNDLMPALESPLLFPNPSGGGNAYGFPAELIEPIIDAVMDAEKSGALPARYTEVVKRVNILNRGLRRVGIIGLVDEATGYQRIREERALTTILEKFIAEELQSWTKTFPYEFYDLIYKLKGWSGPDGHKRTPLIGHYTNDIVYDRLAPGVLAELRKRTPRLPSGNRPHKFFQWFTPDIGHPKLKEHLAGVMARLCALHQTGLRLSVVSNAPTPS